MSHERRIVSRVHNAEIIAGLKAGATAFRARFTQLNSIPAQRGDPADLVVIEVGELALTLQDMEAAKGVFPGSRLLVIAGADARPDEVRRLFRAGAADVLSAPVSQEQLLAAMSDAIGVASQGATRGSVTAVVKAAGGVGATTIAANVAGLMASPVGKRGDDAAARQVALIDFDIQAGDLALAFDVRARASITDILKSPKRLDGHFLDGVMERHKSGVRLLAAPPTIIPYDAVDSGVALNVVETAARSFDSVLIDMPGAWTDWTSTVLRRADQVLLVANPSVRGVAGARRVLDAATALDLDQSRWRLVFNRAHGALESREIVDRARTALRAPVLATISEDPAVRDATDRGRLIWETAHNSRFAKELRVLVDEIARQQTLADSGQPRRQR